MQTDAYETAQPQILNLDQMNASFGDASVNFTISSMSDASVTTPEHWENNVIPFEEFEGKWRAWQKSIGFDPENPEGSA
ncbi:hypothetical protein [Halocynthiibacter namhaensis]|uniref:hypothetical protein n=1 Tax=Halocynthiibacter namhaensis TaxID=1290553 RepID=UPI0005793919|nr:hypothetical protein [Halocynthiibacter namhaensis]